MSRPRLISLLSITLDFLLQVQFHHDLSYNLMKRNAFVLLLIFLEYVPLFLDDNVNEDFQIQIFKSSASGC